MTDWFERYKPSSRKVTRDVQIAFCIGLIPVLVSLLYLLSEPVYIQPLWFFFLLFSAGAECMLWSAALARTEPRLRIPVLDRAAQRADEWFRTFLFSFQIIFILLSFFAFWFCLLELDVMIYPWQHATVMTLMITFPLRQIHNARRRSRGTFNTVSRTDELARFILITCITLLAAGSLHQVITDPSKYYPEETRAGIVIVWVPAIITMLGALVILLDKLRHRKT